MSLPHYFLEEQIISAETQECFALLLSKDDAKHARVARLAAGEHLAVIDASNDYFECEVVSFEGQLPTVRVTQKLTAACDRPMVTLVQGMAKGEKMELVIRHATELGVDSFVPLKCERSILKLDDKKAADRIKRWQAIAKSAAMQSGQVRVPAVQMPQTVKQLMAQGESFDALFICWEEADCSLRFAQAVEAACAALDKPLSECSFAILVGPEGGLSSHEVDMLLEGCPQARMVSLGSSILRTETAGIVAPALLLFSLGQLGGFPLGGQA